MLTFIIVTTLILGVIGPIGENPDHMTQMEIIKPWNNARVHWGQRVVIYVFGETRTKCLVTYNAAGVTYEAGSIRMPGQITIVIPEECRSVMVMAQAGSQTDTVTLLAER